jgi:hypothetical protein
MTDQSGTADILERLEAAYQKVSFYPETREDGVMGLIALRNLIPEAVVAIRASLQPATPTTGEATLINALRYLEEIFPQHPEIKQAADYIQRTATGGDAVAGDAKVAFKEILSVTDGIKFSAVCWLQLDKVREIASAALRSPDVAGDVQAARTSNAWSASTHDDIIKRLMAGVGMPNSSSLYVAFKQFANELHALAHAAPQSDDLAQPSEQQRIDNAKRITSAVLNTMTNGGDNLAIYEAVWGSLVTSTPRPTPIDHSDEECPNFPGCHCVDQCIDGWKHPSPEVSRPERAKP